MTIYCPPKEIDNELIEFYKTDYIKFLKKITLEIFEEYIKEFSKFNISKNCSIFEGLYDFC